MAGAPRIDSWKLDEIRRYLAHVFPGARLDDYPRGAAVAHLFVVIEGGGADVRKQKRHYLMITRQFFDRMIDPASLRDALESADVARSLVRAGDRTVDLY